MKAMLETIILIILDAAIVVAIFVVGYKKRRVNKKI